MAPPTKILDGFNPGALASPVAPTSAASVPYTDKYIASSGGFVIVEGPAIYGAAIIGPAWSMPYLLAVDDAADFFTTPFGPQNVQKVFSGETSPPPGTVLLMPGDVIRFPQPVSRVKVLPSGIINFTDKNLAFLDILGYGDANETRWPSGRPLLRAYLSDPGPLTSVRTLRVTGTSFVTPLSNTAVPAGRIDAVPAVARQLTPHTKTVAIQICKADGTRLTSETENVEVWWRLASGLWSHNPDDDFIDATGRGRATATHDVECYEINGLARAVMVRLPSAGPSLGAHLSASEL